MPRKRILLESTSEALFPKKRGNPGAMVLEVPTDVHSGSTCALRLINKQQDAAHLDQYQLSYIYVHTFVAYNEL